MGRFRDPQDPLFQALNSSIAFDIRLAPFDLEQSTRSCAHARAQPGSSSRDRSRRARGRAGAGARQRSRRAASPLCPDDEDVHMAIERRLTELIGPVGGQTPHRPLAQRPGRHRRRAAGACPRRAGAHADRCPDEHADRARRASPRLAVARLHPPAARPAGLPLTPPAGLVLEAAPRPTTASASASTATDELPLGSGALAGANFATDRAFVAEQLGFGSVSPNSLDAVSNRDFVLDYLGAAATAPRTCPSSAATWCCGPPRSSASVHAGRRLLLRLEPDAAEEEPRRRRAAARQGPARARAARDAARRAPRPTADLQSGPARGQEQLFDAIDTLALTPAARARAAGARLLRPRAHGRRRHRRAVRGHGCRRPAGAGGRALPRGARNRRRDRARRGRARQAPVGAGRRRAARSPAPQLDPAAFRGAAGADCLA